MRVNADGSFSPATLQIRQGDTIEWLLSSPADSVIPINWDGSSSAYCTSVRPYSSGDPAEFTGPMIQAPSGIYVISPLELGYVIEPAKSKCASGLTPKTTVGAEMLCRGGLKGATMDATWQDPALDGVFIRLLWKDVQIAPGTTDASFDFTVLDREIARAVANGKFYSIGIKAGDDGTPSWLFTNGVTALQLQDSGSDGNEPGCGARMTLGSPTQAAYQNHYFDMLRKVAARIRSRADWYRALAYVKPSGANLFTHENRLPKRCETGCVCNSQIFAQNGYRPSGLYAFYQQQTNLMAAEFPGKTMSYMLIQDGFPRINEAGDYERSDGTSSGGSLPGGTEQTQTILNNGQAAHGIRFAVQHNGLKGKRTDGCLGNVNAPGCPNRWVLQEGLEGQVTGWQTSNESEVGDPAAVDSTLLNALANSQGIFVELYEERFWESVRQPSGVISPAPAGSGRTMAQWSAEFHNRRRTLFPSLGDPRPTVHRFTFTTTGTFHYIHGSRCGVGNATPGTIVVQPATTTTPARRRAAGH
ncbi:MAG TPA: hypothetical protein VNL91_01325 [Thermoanaerobaculia bacterium]|nr:hypothetical protein [Thermoanaerobaculia bacterium]